MTLPSLISYNRMIESVNRFKKAYSVLSQAYKMSELEYGDIENWDWDLNTNLFFALFKYNRELWRYSVKRMLE